MVNRLKADDRLVLEHVARYRMTTSTILAAALDEIEPYAASLLAKLVASGWLVTQSLDLTGAMGKCYHLSERATVKCNVNPLFAKPLAHNARVERFAIATFCCCSDPFRRLFTRDEFIAHFSHLWYSGQPLLYYLESSEVERPKLAFLKVDRGGEGRWDRLIDSCMQFLRQRTEVHRVAVHHRPQTEAFAQLVARGHFQISVLTSLPEKQRAIDLELERRRATQQACPPIRTYVVPGLFDVMFPAPSMATA